MAEILVSAILEELEELASINHQHVGEEMNKDLEKLTTNFKAILKVLVKAESGVQVRKKIAADKAESGLPVGKENAAEKAESGLQVGKEISADKPESGLQIGQENDAVRDWLEELKDTSCDIHEILVECRTLIEKASRKVFSLTPCHRICFSQDMLHDCVQKIEKLIETLNSLEKVKPDFSLERPPTTSTIDLSKVHGRAQDIESLVTELLKKSEKPAPIPVISIVGMAGIGKTTLAQAVFNDKKVQTQTNFEKTKWVCVSGTFDKNRVGKEIHECLGKKFLIILDDVWTLDPNDWKQFKDSLESDSNEGSSESDSNEGSSESNSNKGRILVTTRKKDVAENIGSTKIILLQTLSQDDSWSLFKKLANTGKNSEELNKQFETSGRKIANKCKGLPLAIMTLGSLLQSKKNIEEWQNVADSEMWKLKEVQEKIFPSLLSTYFDLPFESRKIFSYCAIFPKDYEIEKNTLIDLRMTQYNNREEQTEDADLVSNDECIEKLATYYFLKDFRKNEFDGSVESFTMYDIMHEFAQFLSKHGWFTEDIHDFQDSRVNFSCGKAQHLVLGLMRGELYPMHINGGKKISSLAVRCDRNMDSMTLSKLFGDFPSLRRLYLSNCDLSVENLPREIKKLMHLQYLDLSRSVWLRELPEALCEVNGLKTLNLNGCISLKKLPQGIGKLKNLRHLLNCCTYRSLSHLPKGIEKLNGLQTLTEFVASRDRQSVKGGLKCLEKLNNLQGALDILKLQDVAKKSDQVQRANLKDMKKLFSLRLDFGWKGKEPRLKETVIEEILEISEVLEAPPPNLKTLGIYSYQGKKSSFNWTLLTKLKVLTLNNCVNWENLPPLGKLSSLESLHISHMDSVKKVGDEFFGTETANISTIVFIVFQNLKILTFSQMANWEDWNWIVSKRVMPNLESLSISFCNKLKSLPDYIFEITTRKKLEINGCSLLQDLYKEQSGEGWSKISRIPNREIK